MVCAVLCTDEIASIFVTSLELRVFTPCIMVSDKKNIMVLGHTPAEPTPNPPVTAVQQSFYYSISTFFPLEAARYLFPQLWWVR